MLIGYARTSTVDQVAGLEAPPFDRLRMSGALGATSCTKLFCEQASSVGQRDQLDAALDFVREGDALVVTRLDRLARSTADLLAIVATLEAKQVGLRILDFGGSEVDTRSPTGRMLLTMFAAVAEFERAIMLERQPAGVARARAQGKYKGRAPTARRKAGRRSTGCWRRRERPVHTACLPPKTRYSAPLRRQPSRLPPRLRGG